MVALLTTIPGHLSSGVEADMPTSPDSRDSDTTITVDIVSDVVCPWCIIGYRQLAEAARKSGIDIEVHWHPFALQ